MSPAKLSGAGDNEISGLNGGVDHVEEDGAGPDPRMRNAEIHGCKLKEKKRQKQQQQQQRWSLTENPSNGSSSSTCRTAAAAVVATDSKMATRVSVDMRSLGLFEDKRKPQEV